MDIPAYITLGIMVLIGIGLIVWDLYLLHDKKPDNTISAVMRLMGRYGAWQYSWGVLGGHCFWWRETFVQKNYWYQFVGLWGLAGLLILVDVFWHNHWLVKRLRHPPIFFFTGVLMGAALWPQYAWSPGA